MAAVLHTPRCLLLLARHLLTAKPAVASRNSASAAISISTVMTPSEIRVTANIKMAFPAMVLRINVLYRMVLMAAAMFIMLVGM